MSPSGDRDYLPMTVLPFGTAFPKKPLTVPRLPARAPGSAVADSSAGYYAETGTRRDSGTPFHSLQ